MVRVVLLFICGFVVTSIAVAQHNVDFTIEPSVCRGELLTIQNNSDPGTSVEWMFCPKVEGTYTSTAHGTIKLSLSGMSMVESNGLWYGFAITQSNELLRVEFGDNPGNTGYTVVSLGNPGGLLNSPDGIKVIASAGKWYGLVTNLAGEPLIRLNWTSLLAAPVAQNLGLSALNKFSSPSQIDIKLDGSSYVAVVANSTSNKLTLVNFGDSMENIPGAANILESPVLPGSLNMFGVTVSRRCDQWEIYTNVTNKLFKISMGSTLFSPITAGQILDFSADIPITIGSYNRMQSIVSGTDTYVYFSSYTGQYFSAAIWHEGATHAVFKDLRFLAVPDQLYSLTLYEFNSGYGFYLGSFGTGSIQNIVITPACNASQQFSQSTTPKGISYSAAGTYTVALTIKFSDGTSCSDMHTVTVSANLAPDINFSTQNNCAQHNINFTPANSSGNVNSYTWDFGDAAASSAQNAIHSYTTAGTYLPKLIGSSTNGCHNSVEKTLTVYNPPVPEFTLPSSGTICTNQTYVFANTSTFDAASNPAWQWSVNGAPVATTTDLNYTLSSTATQQFALSASLPGCTAQVMHSISTILPGPTIDFTFGTACQNNALSFTNASSGSIQTYSWDFGDGHSSNQISPVNTYSSSGPYSVLLTGFSTNGCQNSSTHTISVHSQPTPDFVLELPPFSCSGTPSQFTDATPSPTDSNISSWDWTFGDASNGTSDQRNPLYTYSQAGPYDVTLTTKTNFGCSATKQKTVTITQAPTASFINTIACAQQGTQFNDTSVGTINSWSWKINTSQYLFSNPIHVFGSSGDYLVDLTVKDINGCLAETTKMISVPISQQPDFSVAAACANKQAVFTDITPPSADPIISRLWDFAGLGTTTGSPATFAFPAVQSYSIKMDARAQSGCVYSVSKSIAVSAPPVASFMTSVDAGPAPLTVHFTNTSALATEYEWRFHDVANSTTTESSPVFTFDNLGDYVVDLDAINAIGCVDTYSKIVHAVNARIDASIALLQLVNDPATNSWQTLFVISNEGNFPIRNPTLYVTVSDDLVLTENLQITVPAGQRISQVLNFNLTPGDVKYVCVSLKEEQDVNPYNDKQCIAIDDGTIIFTPYPNPVSGEFHVDWISNASGRVQISIFTATGTKALDQTIDATGEGLNQVRLDVSDLSPGVYIARISLSGVVRSFRFVVS